jgi:shikimate dehydrogenase
MISAGVLGSPISHSLSPLLHNTIYDSLGIDASYRAYEVASGDLRSFLDGEGSSLNCLSLTMPLKEEALTIAGLVSDISRQIQSGNTLHKVDGAWNLTSTDVDGFAHALEINERDAKGSVLIIGAGATARAVIAACDGVSDKVTVVNRSAERETAIRSSAPNTEVDFVSWSDEINFGSFDLVVNTSPGNAATVFVSQVQSVASTFFEVLYNPWPTPLLAQWRLSGGLGIDGLDLLIHQAISQASIFAESPIDRDSMAKILRSAGEKALS